MHFESKYDRSLVHPGVTFTAPSLTQQHFKDEADINKIIARYNRTGVLVDPTTPRSGDALFGDFSEVKDFSDAQNFICMAKEAFMELDSSIRRRFHNDPAELIAFLNDPSNIEEGRKLGIYALEDPITIPEVPRETKDGDSV